jgi:long-chain acyl-CoA synthetase
MSDHSWKNLFDAFARTAKEHSERRAVVAGRVTLSYADLLRSVDGLCESLNNAEVECGDRVAVLLPNGPEFVIATLAIWQKGAVVAPFHVKSHRDELARYLIDCEVKVLLADSQMADLVEALRRGHSAIRSAILSSSETSEWTRHGRSDSRERAGAVADSYRTVTSASAALTQYSTGSTGRSKRITRSHQQLLDEYNTVASLLQITHQDRILAAVPMCHSYGFMNAMIHGFLSGAALFPVKDFFVRDVVRLIERERITSFPGVPVMYQQLAEFSGTADLSSIRCARSTGAPLTADTIRSVMEKYGVAIYQQYGSTETGMISINLGADWETPPTTVGHAIPGVTIDIVDDDRKPVPLGTTGNVAIRSVYASSCYDGDPVESDSYFEAGAFYPGDQGSLDQCGRLELRGRTRRFVNVAGNKVDPMEIELLLQGHPAVSAAIVVGIADAAGGEKVKALVVLKSSTTERELFDYCRSKVADFKCPRVIEFRDEVPRNPMGKVVRKELLDE